LLVSAVQAEFRVAGWVTLGESLGDSTLERHSP
jgi:hypothetical protein